MKTIYKVKVTVFSNVGTFSGFLPTTPHTLDGTEGFCRDREFALLNNTVTNLVLENRDGTKVKVAESVLANAVLETEVVSV